MLTHILVELHSFLLLLSADLSMARDLLGKSQNFLVLFLSVISSRSLPLQFRVVSCSIALFLLCNHNFICCLDNGKAYFFMMESLDSNPVSCFFSG